MTRENSSHSLYLPRSSSSLRHALSLLAGRYLPLGVLDTLVVFLSLVLAWSVRAITVTLDFQPALPFAGVTVVVYFIVNQTFRLYHRIWRYASAGEIVVIAAAVGISTAILVLIDLLWPALRPVPLSVVLLTGQFSFVGFVSLRYRGRVWSGFRRYWRSLQGQTHLTQTRVLVVGAGEAGQQLVWRFLNSNEGDQYKVVGFVDDDPDKHNLRLHGIRVLGDRHALPDLVARYEVDLVIIAIYNITGPDFQDILDICEQAEAVIKVLPNIFDFLQDKNDLPLIRDVTAEDLLGRKPARIDRPSCQRLIVGKTVLVTGAAGSIGSELCRQIADFGPCLLIMLDNNETGLYELMLDLGQSRVMKYIICDITNRNKLDRLFEDHRPELIFHAAAYKHVPLMEEHPDEAIRVNVLGTRILADLAAKHNSERFVLISSDKAVNPCCVMGATKRLGEMLITFVGNDTALERRTLFTAVRFGNVLGSRGSVVPVFERQIAQGGPVTVTHPEMTRYFMSVSEAVSLVIQAAALTEGGDIFMLRMGQRIRIDDLARRLIRLHGLRPEVDIPVTYTGPRPGEKMHEELLDVDEERYSTSHPHIFRVHSNGARDEAELQRHIKELQEMTSEQRNGDLVLRLRDLVM